VVYYGLMPGLIHDRYVYTGRSFPKWKFALDQCNDKSPEELKNAFHSILASLLTGRLKTREFEMFQFSSTPFSMPAAAKTDLKKSVGRPTTWNISCLV
jgi:hypothetical protein